MKGEGSAQQRDALAKERRKGLSHHGIIPSEKKGKVFQHRERGKGKYVLRTCFKKKKEGGGADLWLLPPRLLPTSKTSYLTT